MTPVFQTTQTNCLSAAVASVLDCSLNEIPYWGNLIGMDYLRTIAKWAIDQGLGFCFFDLKNRLEWPVLANHYVIVAGDTSRSKEYFHTVVARTVWTGEKTRLEYVHDPYEYGDYIRNPDHCLFFIPKNGVT